MADDDDDKALGHASWAVLQALMIVLTERGRIEADNLTEALEEAADFQARKAEESDSNTHRRAAQRLQEVVRDVRGADPKR
jgi:glycine cleavage system protein P-like pyridoxal-binding family